MNASVDKCNKTIITDIVPVRQMLLLGLLIF
jgi:hypothetical protein